jgi:hypothetical protein
MSQARTRNKLADRSAWVGQSVAAARGRRPPFALCYHGVGPRPEDPHGLFVGTAEFADHLDALLADGFRLVGVTELWRETMPAPHTPTRPSAGGLGAITLDDGLADTLRAALPVARERGVTLTAYIPTGLMGRPHPHLPGGQRIVDAVELRELEAEGLEIGAHTVDHFNLSELSYADALDQLRRSRATLEDILGHEVTGMAYPFGVFTDATIEATQEAGYELACACNGPGRWLPLAIPREPVHPSTSVRRVRMKAAGLFGAVHAASGVRRRVRALRRTMG